MAVTGRTGPPGEKGYDGQELEFGGTIKHIEHKDRNTILHIKDTYLSDGTDLNGSVLMYIPDQEKITTKLHIGMKITARGEFNRFRTAHNRGQFDLSRHYAVKGYHYAVYDGRVLSCTVGYNRIADGLYRIKERTEAVYEHYLDGTDQGVLEALTLADKGDLDKDLKDRYSDAGIAHILALSGLHIATVGFLLVNLLRKIRLPLWLAAAMSTFLMLAYCIMTGMPVSAIRALIMYLLAIGAMLLKRSVDLRTSASIAALIMLTVNPDRLYDASFIMSFISVLGIGLVYPYLRNLVLNVFGSSRVRILKRSENKLVRFGMGILTSLVLSLSIQLAITPFTMWFYYRIPVYGILINLIVVPLAGVLLVLAVTVAVLGSLALYVVGIAGLLDMPVRFISLLTHLILRFYDLLTQGVNRLPGAVLVTGRPAVWQMFLYYMFLAGIVIYSAYLGHKEKLLKGKIRKRRSLRSSEEARKMKDHLRERSRFALMILGVSFILLFFRIQPSFEISALYVGQGQCFVIHGRDVPTVMYDCGSTDEKKLYEYTVEPFLECMKLSDIDTVFISHLDTDHVSGILQFLSEDDPHIRVGRIVISADKSQEQSENYESLLALAHKRGIPVCAMNAGGSIKWRNLKAKCLWPLVAEENTVKTNADPVGSPGNNIEKTNADSAASPDLNDGSLVLSFEYRSGKGNLASRGNCRSKGSSSSGGSMGNGNSRGSDLKKCNFRILFTGDISSGAEERLIEAVTSEGSGGGGYDCLQVAHHGSAGSANEAFIKAVSPRLAIISAGIDNRYGHPHKETLELLDTNKIPAFVTAESGEIDIKQYPGRLRVVKYRNGE